MNPSVQRVNGIQATARRIIFLAILSAHLLAQRSMAETPARFTNSLGLIFVKVPGTSVAFSIWQTRAQDYALWAKESGTATSDPGFLQLASHPVVNMSWDNAHAFCKWLTDKERKAGNIGPKQFYRLPTDAEWSVAVGLPEEAGATPEEKDGKIKDVYPWGTQWPPPDGAGNYHGKLKVDKYENTAPVGSFSPNRFGLYDLGSNVIEWCEDYYNTKQTDRTTRGASWMHGKPNSLMCSHRGFSKPKSAILSVGFRCVLAETSAASP
jgi:formylglycine-generating enzyme required for sulfatase activity